MATLLDKYNVPGPRYTSYPTVPYWDESQFSLKKYKETVNTIIKESDAGISLYIHLPFCESLCTFCGCHKRITKNHKNEEPYIAAVLKEWRMYCHILGEKPKIKELHLGGGTPTFFSVKNLEQLINGIFSLAQKDANCEMSFEGHPNNTTREHLQKLYDVGFRRVSFGVQDYSEKVQKAIHRIQPFSQVAKITLIAREIGYSSIGHDLIYGLPFQTLEDIADTIEKTVALMPDRIAFYGYAHTPWIKGNGQRGFSAEDIPSGEEKRQLYENGREMLMEAGYLEIGMDHFALEEDPLYQASKKGKLHRNFMGYTESDTKCLIGLGISAISDTWFGFAQNTKNLEDYYQILEWDELPVVKGHILTTEDLAVKQHILNVMCRFKTTWNEGLSAEIQEDICEQLLPLKVDGLVDWNEEELIVSELGQGFVRNVCMAFDRRLQQKQFEKPVFSSTV